MAVKSQRHKPRLAVQPLTRIPLREEVHRTLRRVIVQGQLEGGAKILEGRIAAALGVSRTPVREALRQLESDGLVITRSGYSTRVTTLTLSDVEEIYPIIAALEGLAAQLATPNLTKADLDYMGEITNAMARYARSGKIEKLMAADGQFHGVLHEQSQNRRLQRIVRELRGQMERFEYAFFSSKDVVRDSLKRHRNLVRVLKQRNALVAQRTLVRQWDQGRRTLARVLREKKMAMNEPQETAKIRKALAKTAPRARVSV